MDSICLEMINCDCEKQLKQLLGFEIYSKVKSIECNITQKVSGEAALQELRFQKEHNIRVMVLELPTTLIVLSSMENSMARMMMETINNMMIELYASMAQAEIEKKEKRNPLNL